MELNGRLYSSLMNKNIIKQLIPEEKLVTYAEFFDHRQPMRAVIHTLTPWQPSSAPHILNLTRNISPTNPN